jgi:hypothetical protein
MALASTAFGGANAIHKSYVSSVNFLDQREILNRLLNVTNEDYSFLDVMELMGRSVETAVPQYHTFVNAELYGGAVTTAADGVGTVTTAKRVFELVLSAAPSTEEVRVGDLLMFPNGNVGYVQAISSATLDIVSVGADLYSAESDLNAVKVVAFSNAAGEGSKSPKARRVKPVKQANQVQIFKEKYAITDIQNASKIEFEFKGQPYYFLKGQHEALTRFRGDIAFALMFGDASTSLFTDATPALVDSEGNPIQTTKGLRHSIIDGGVTQTGTGDDGTLENADFSALTKTLNKKRAPREYMMFVGSAGDIAVDNYLNSLGNTDLSSNARFSIDGRDIDLGVDKFRLYGRSFIKKYLPMLDHQQVVNFTGSAGLQDEMYLVPNDTIKAAGSGESMDRMRIRYMAGNGTDLKYRETMLGGLAPTPTDERSILECHYESVQGLEVLGVEHFVKFDLGQA